MSEKSSITELMAEINGSTSGLSVRKSLIIYHILLSCHEFEHEDNNLDRAMDYLNQELMHVTEGTYKWERSIEPDNPRAVPVIVDNDDELPF